MKLSIPTWVLFSIFSGYFAITLVSQRLLGLRAAALFVLLGKVYSTNEVLLMLSGFFGIVALFSFFLGRKKKREKVNET